jgi:hypothetical protein
MKIGRTVCCKKDIQYLYKGKMETLKKGYSMIIKGIVGDDIIADRFGKPFILKAEDVEIKH